MNIFYLIHLIHGKKFLKKIMFCRWLCNEFKSKWFNIRNTNYKNIYIPPSPGDAGGSVGSALYQFSKINKLYENKYYSLLVHNLKRNILKNL